MSDIFFPRFLKNAREYQQAQRLWQSHWEKLIEGAGQRDCWEWPWLATTFADGTPCRDGNPIFSAVNRKDRLGIRVIQLEPGSDPAEISHWTDNFGKRGRNAIRELVVACVLSEYTLHEAADLMNQWLTRRDGRRSPRGKRRAAPRKMLGKRS